MFKYRSRTIVLETITPFPWPGIRYDTITQKPVVRFNTIKRIHSQKIVLTPIIGIHSWINLPTLILKIPSRTSILSKLSTSTIRQSVTLKNPNFTVWRTYRHGYCITIPQWGIRTATDIIIPQSGIPPDMYIRVTVRQSFRHGWTNSQTNNLYATFNRMSLPVGSGRHGEPSFAIRLTQNAKRPVQRDSR